MIIVIQFANTTKTRHKTNSVKVPVDPTFLLGFHNEVFLFPFLKNLETVDELLTVHETLYLHKFQLLLQHLKT
jgi:hypothetical protein